MITICLQRSKDERITGFSVTGHSGYADHGSDIVCAGVSAITQTTILGLQNVLRIECTGSQADGELHCFLPRNLRDEVAGSADLLLSTMLLGLRALESVYTGYVRILDLKEV